MVPLLFETKLPNKILGHVNNSINIKCGAVVIYFYVFGRRVPVLIDTLIPTGISKKKKGIPILSKPSDNLKSPWFCLVEKAFIKLHGTFDNIISGFFGYSTYSLFFYRNFHVDSVLSFSDIMEYQEKGYIICASISEERKKYLLKEKKLHKLNCKHAYVIQKARIYNENNFLLMQNPWGETHWDGDYSENSNLWNDELIKALKGDFSPAGSFWMQYNDFKEIFDEFEVTKPIEPEWHIKMFQYQL